MKFPLRTLLWSLLAFPGLAAPESLSYEVTGVKDALRDNVYQHLESFDLGGNRVTENNRSRLVDEAEMHVFEALRPYGYYKPEVASSMISQGGDNWVLRLQIDRGPPVSITTAKVEIIGEGNSFSELVDWQRRWPLPAGTVLNQALWESRKIRGLEIAESYGFLNARYAEQSIKLDLEQNSADLSLVLDTGPRFVMGDIRYEQSVVKQSVLDNVPRFRKGDPYTKDLLEKFRTDLWKTGNFTDVEVIEVQNTDVSPPAVDLETTLETDTRNEYQGSVGVGTDTGARLQALWSRHPVSSYGDRLDVGAGWRQTDNEVTLRAEYRIPRRNTLRQYWVSSAAYKTELRDFEFKENPEDEDNIRLASGRINDVIGRVGRLKVRNRANSDYQTLETWFTQYLVETSSLSVLPDFPGSISDPEFEESLAERINSLAIGIDWDLPSIKGKGFQTAGSRDRAWIMGASSSFGSDDSFVQLYASTRRNYLLGERWKILLRGEVGYTNARINEFTITVDGRDIVLPVPTLPDLYRFKAGGSQSVRGYGFEDLSNNDLGSNNIITASAEIEMKFLDNWAASLFYDIGNAFNDWGDPDLKRGVGVGLRWYMIAGSLRVDYAQALDFPGKPWRWHLTIGTPLL